MQSDVFSPLADFLTKADVFIRCNDSLGAPHMGSVISETFGTHAQLKLFFSSKLNFVTLECHQVACQPGVSVALWSPLLANWNNGRTPVAPGVVYEAIL